MIRKINKIMALVLIATSICTISPMGIANINAKAADTTSSTTSSNEAAFAAVAEAGLLSKLNGEYSLSLSPGVDIPTIEKCGTLSYTLTDAAAMNIVTTKIDPMLTEPNFTIMKANLDGLYYYYGITGAQSVKNSLIAMAGVDDSQRAAMVKSAAQSIPVYRYTVKNGSSIKAQGFMVGGLFGLSTYPSDTFNGTEKDATYSSIALVPSLPLSVKSTYGKEIDISASGVSVICDGLNINVMDTTNNKLYTINNPVYKMLKVPSVVESAHPGSSPNASDYADKLNIIDFTGAANLKGFKSSIDLSSQGMSTTILGISLTTSDSTNKNYQYALPVEGYEKQMLDAYIDSMNLSTIGDTLKGMVTTGSAGTYTMIPNTGSEIDNVLDKTGVSDTIDGVTNGLNDVSDALNDLTDSINDKNNDVNQAWDKVFDRFNNSEGWGQKDGYIYYYDKDGVSLKGVQKISGRTYYFNRIDGAMETGWQIVDGKKCYFDKKKGYQLVNQLVKENDDTYFLGENGAVKKMEWANIQGKNYYFKADGKMAKGWFKVEEYWYFFNEDGSAATSTWKSSDGKWYYLKDNGQAAVDWFKIGDRWYYFKDPSGVLQTGWFRAHGSWYCSNEDGSMKTGWASSSDGWCYLDDVSGKMKKNEWVTIDGKSYYFNINGIMVTGSRYINGTKYTFNSDGTLNQS